MNPEYSAWWFGVRVFVIMLVAGQAPAGEPSAPGGRSSGNTLLPLNAVAWVLAADTNNTGRTEAWWKTPRPGARPIRVHSFGKGKVVLNTFNILENVDKHPAADALLMNLVTYASRATGEREK